jgi:AGZA family xanthine/uracil permease-like MFS transporter
VSDPAPPPGRSWLDRFFELRERGTTVATELRAGAVTFVTLCYIIFVQPGVLSQYAKMDFGAVMVATCLSAALATLIMGLWANYPIAEAPLMGENFFFAISVVMLMGVPWTTALGIVFLSGLIFLALTVLRVREMVMDAVPMCLKAAIAGGIGLFIAFIGLYDGGIITKNPAVPVQIGDLGAPVALVTLAGLALTAILLVRRVRGGILLGMAATTLLALAPIWHGPDGKAAEAAGLVSFQGIFAAPPSLQPTLLMMDIPGALRHVDLIFIFLFMLMFDTIGTLIGVSQQAGLLVEGKLPRADRAMMADALGTVAGAALGTSTVSSYIESAAGVADGARTGLANVMTALLFLAALFLSPLVALVGGGVKVGETFFYPITAPIIILVGSFMMAALAEIDWKEPSEAIPAFLTVVMIPFTFNIAHGVAIGVVAYALAKLAAGRAREVSWLIWLLALVLVICYATLPRLRH